jgi:hypothetical protein
VIGITVPESALLGATRMRIRIQYVGDKAEAGPCGVTQNGEVEDYTVNIVIGMQACCYADGSCSDLLPADCAADGGFALGIGTTCATSNCRPYCTGDVNCDGQIDFGDINPFVQYLSAYESWLASYPDCNPLNGDINHNGIYGQGAFDDINPFVALLSSGALPIPCPVVPTGACCFGDGHCELLIHYACVTAGGTSWLGGQTCESNPCPQLGSCCYGNGTCGQTFEADCLADPNNSWNGAITSCDPNPCELAGKECISAIPIAIGFAGYGQTCGLGNDYTSECLGAYSTGEDIFYRFDVAVDTCVDIVVTLDKRGGGGGFYFGFAVDPNCPPGADCIAATASSGDYYAQVLGLNLTAGTYYLMIDSIGEFTPCFYYYLSIKACPPPTGACCRNYNERCDDDVIEADCQGPHDTWYVGQRCASITCPTSPTVACCFGDGTCQDLLPADCAAAGGHMLEVQSTCALAICRPFCTGDMNCDGVIDFGDINPFVQFLSDAEGWGLTYTGCNPVDGDINHDGIYGQASFGDINPFVALLSSGQLPIYCITVPNGACCSPTGGCLGDGVSEWDCRVNYEGIYAGNGTDCGACTTQPAVPTPTPAPTPAPAIPAPETSTTTTEVDAVVP